MAGILLANFAHEGVSLVNYFENEDYKKVGISDTSTTLIPMYKELFRKAVGNKVDEDFEDYLLSKLEIESIKSEFGIKLENTLPLREPNPENAPIHKRFKWKGEVYELFYSLTYPNNRIIINLWEIIEMCEESMKNNTSLYLSMD